MATAYERLLEEEQLPASYATIYDGAVLPCATEIAILQSHAAHTVLIGINGTQGSGKSTLARFLALALEQEHELSAVVLSLDDIYLTKAEREELAKSVHPLLRTRGVPGTHDLALGYHVIDRLRTADPDTKTPLPCFDKARDDRCPERDWPVFTGRPDVILLEGWCVASPSQSEAELAVPLNPLERNHDGDGIWRHFVNAQLSGPYAKFFDSIDSLIMLNAPSFDAVLAWRMQQEEKLARRMRDAGKDINSLAIMTTKELVHFLMHYERITRHTLRHLPEKAAIRVDFDMERHLLGLEIRRPAGQLDFDGKSRI